MDEAICCKNCKYSERYYTEEFCGLTKEYFKCHRHPPIRSEATGDDSYARFCFPVVRSDDWCGEFSCLPDEEWYQGMENLEAALDEDLDLLLQKQAKRERSKE